MKPRRINRPQQNGALLIEVLVAMLLLSFGMLSLGAMLSFSVQMPKLSGYRALAVNLASSHIDSIRANPGGFDDYINPKIQAPCEYPQCKPQSLAAMDDAATRQAVRTALPAGYLHVTCNTNPCNKSSRGNLWIAWQEPSTYKELVPSSWDNCPAEVTKVFADTKPRCVYVGFNV